ncbi:MAG TPA: tRNA (N(6)-L-threonylcarbamoyladenosine(37)-C(2))-methylthiotransferase MtaB [Syntrophorhabdaceae bacterium]|nr:tRNA (N(6)-L-threonylcarbamoyladenosine(37)-C(2))-methylthiotransferase MtaB [Syntrophorhabdaceae bacterium]
MKFHIKTTGCRANQWDSYVISNTLNRNGCAQTKLEDADICIINACTLTEAAERDIKRFINQCRARNPKSTIVLAGCHAQVYPEKGFGADFVLGNKEKFSILEYIGLKERSIKTVDDTFLEKAEIDGLPTGKTRFFLKIQDGCDKFCSYCIVPFARGKGRSRKEDEILMAMESLYEKGVKEVVLTGIEISAYKDEKTGDDLNNLLKILEDAKTPPRIRLSSIDPIFITDKFIDIMASSKKIARSIHISAQSFSDKVLHLMKREYTKAYLVDTIKKLVKRIEDIGIGLDIISGFPSEDEDAFLETFNSIENLDIYYLHVFSFSPRQKTEAAFMPNQIPDRVKKERVNKLRLLDRRKRIDFYDRFIGKNAIIIPEGKVYRGNFIKGFTDNYIPVFIKHKKSLENSLIEVKIKDIEDGFLIGECL